MTKELVLLLAFVPIMATAQKEKNTAQAKKVESVSVMKTKTDSASYAFGLKIATDLKSSGVEALNIGLWSKAMEQVFKDEKTELSEQQAQSIITSFMGEKNEKRSENLKAEGDKFLAENKKKPGVVTTASGLQYTILQPGTGPKPSRDSEVTVHYKGTLLNGNQFDSSYDRGEPITFELARVIPGWVEGLQLMQEGSKYRFFIPWKLAYGAEGAGHDIPPYSVLIFDIELLKSK
ncbi:FKBP-type peptidyl-prolyl cis-trans isomerase [Flavihumibacter sp. R14]|nr:FKBP-type peptidyl-prolyl cis-trans isomerase [Flavihumibacter soli]